MELLVNQYLGRDVRTIMTSRPNLEVIDKQMKKRAWNSLTFSLPAPIKHIETKWKAFTVSNRVSGKFGVSSRPVSSSVKKSRRKSQRGVSNKRNVNGSLNPNSNNDVDQDDVQEDEMADEVEQHNDVPQDSGQNVEVERAGERDNEVTHGVRVDSSQESSSLVDVEPNDQETVEVVETYQFIDTETGKYKFNCDQDGIGDRKQGKYEHSFQWMEARDKLFGEDTSKVHADCREIIVQFVAIAMYQRKFTIYRRDYSGASASKVVNPSAEKKEVNLESAESYLKTQTKLFEDGGEQYLKQNKLIVVLKKKNRLDREHLVMTYKSFKECLQLVLDNSIDPTNPRKFSCRNKCRIKDRKSDTIGKINGIEARKMIDHLEKQMVCCFACAECPLQFLNSASFNQHYSKQHVKNGDKQIVKDAFKMFEGFCKERDKDPGFTPTSSYNQNSRNQNPRNQNPRNFSFPFKMPLEKDGSMSPEI